MAEILTQTKRMMYEIFRPRISSGFNHFLASKVLLLTFDLNLKHFRSKIEKSLIIFWVCVCQIFCYFDFFSFHFHVVHLSSQIHNALTEKEKRSKWWENQNISIRNFNHFLRNKVLSIFGFVNSVLKQNNKYIVSTLFSRK